MTILALDQSTTSTSGFLFDEAGRAERIFHADHRQLHPQAGWVEHDPDELLANLRAALATGKHLGAQAVGLANQGESCLAWDAGTKRPLSPVIVWQDGRTADACRDLAARGHGETVRRIAGLPLEPYFSASKLRWILDTLPDARTLADRRRLRLGTTDAFFRDVLGGDFATDVATASRTALMDLRTGQWDAELCAIFGIPPDCLPRITDCSGQLGTLDGLPLTAAIVDQQAAMAGHGLTRAGEIKITFGTGAFAFALTDDLPDLRDTAILPTVAWREAGAPLRHALDGGIYTASSALNWARGLGLFDEFDQLSFDGPGPLRDGLAFVPAQAGLAAPHWDRDARGAWLGLSLTTTKSDMVRAILEGIAYRAAEVVAAMAARVDLQGPLRIDGGMTANRWFCQLLADVTGREVEVAGLPDLTALGMARLAARATGRTIPLPPPACRLSPDPQAEVRPDLFARAREAAQAWGRTMAAQDG